MRILFGLVTCLMFGLAASNAAFSAWIYDANSQFKDFELANNGNNVAPAFSNFMVGTGTTLGDFTPFAPTLHTDNWISRPEVQGWTFINSQSVPAVVVNTTNAPIGQVDPYQILMHPGGTSGKTGDAPISNAVLRFTASNAGIYSVIGDWKSLDIGSTINYVLKNGTAIFTDTSDATSNFNLTNISLANGDTIDFVVSSNGGIDYDTTGLRVTLTGVPEPTTLALFGLGGIGLAGIAKRRRTRKVA